MKDQVDRIEESLDKGGKTLRFVLETGESARIVRVHQHNNHRCPVGGLMALQVVVIVGGEEILVVSSHWTVAGTQIDSASVTQNINQGEGNLLQGPRDYHADNDRVAVAWSEAGTFDVAITADCGDAGLFQVVGTMRVVAPVIQVEDPQIGNPEIQGDLLNQQELRLAGVEVDGQNVGIAWKLDAFTQDDDFPGSVGFIQKTLGRTERTATNGITQGMGTNAHYFLDFDEEAQQIWYSSLELDLGDVTDVYFRDTPSVLLERTDGTFPNLVFDDYGLHDNFYCYVAYKAAEGIEAMIESYYVTQRYINWYWVGIAGFNAQANRFVLGDNESFVGEVQGNGTHWHLPTWRENAADYEDWN